MSAQESIRTEKLCKGVADGTITSRAAILVLVMTSDTGSLQVQIVARELGMSIPRASMLGTTLEKQGLIDRCVPVNDMRQVAFALTQNGYAAARQHAANLKSLIGDAARV